MHFFVSGSSINKDEEIAYPRVLIFESQWNDYSYRTLCLLSVQMSAGSDIINLGSTRIMYRGQRTDTWTLEGWKEFSKLSSKFCSLGHNEEFYDRIFSLGKNFAMELLLALRDAAFNNRIWTSFADEPAFKVSLLRYALQASVVRDKLSGMLKKKKVARLSFEYEVSLREGSPSHKINFDFKKRSILPHRAILLVGKNGVGKTQLMANLAIALSGITNRSHKYESEDAEKIINSGLLSPFPSFYSVIAISFNAFDKFEIPIVNYVEESRTKYIYCGLRKSDGALFSELELMNEISSTVRSMEDKQRRQFRSSAFKILGQKIPDNLLEKKPEEFYSKFSSGQRIVLNILVHLCKNLESGSLVLFDEPETHLHPNLMSNLVSEVLSLLNKRNAYAIIASHSPIIAQQIPSQNIRMIARTPSGPEITIPPIECFGENLSEISSVLFESKEKDRDYITELLRFLKYYDNDISKVMELFNDGLGSNAKAILWSRTIK